MKLFYYKLYRKITLVAVVLMYELEAEGLAADWEKGKKNQQQKTKTHSLLWPNMDDKTL